MDDKSIQIIGLIFQGVALISTMIGGFWIFNNMISSKINRLYERMDEKFKESKDEWEKKEREFVRLDVHNITIKHQEEKTDEKFKQIVQVFELKMSQLTDAVKNLVQDEKDRLNSHKTNNK